MIDSALQKGIEAHKAGRLQEADRFYTAILETQPKHPDANHNMGVLAVSAGKVEQSLSFFKTALETKSAVEQFWLSYIDALMKFGWRVDAKEAVSEAKEIYSKSENLYQLELEFNSVSLSGINFGKTQESLQTELQLLIQLYNRGQLNEVKDSFFLQPS